MFWKKAESLPAAPLEELARMAAGESPPVIVDVCDPRRFPEGDLPGAINIPLSVLEQRANQLDPAAPTVFTKIADSKAARLVA
jgi:rhodanese-related sulfurtransferase